MTAADVPTPWLLLPEAMTYARIGRTDLIAALETGALRGHQTKPGARWRIHRDDLDAWLRGEKPPAINPTFTRRTA